MMGAAMAMRRFAVALAMAAALAGCETATNDRTASTDVARRHPIVVTSQTVRLPVFVAGGALPAADAERLAGFVDEFLRAGGGVLEISAPQGMGRAQALAQASAVREAALKRGVRPDEVQMRLSEDPAGAPLVVSYERYSAQGPACGDLSQNDAANDRNLAHPSFGCAYQSNLAAMVANPADLVRPRGETPPDAARKSAVVQNYRAGQHTESAVGPTALRSLATRVSDF